MQHQYLFSKKIKKLACLLYAHFAYNRQIVNEELIWANFLKTLFECISWLSFKFVVLF